MAQVTNFNDSTSSSSDAGVGEDPVPAVVDTHHVAASEQEPRPPTPSAELVPTAPAVPPPSEREQEQEQQQQEPSSATAPGDAAESKKVKFAEAPGETVADAEPPPSQQPGPVRARRTRRPSAVEPLRVPVSTFERLAEAERPVPNGRLFSHPLPRTPTAHQQDQTVARRKGAKAALGEALRLDATRHWLRFALRDATGDAALARDGRSEVDAVVRRYEGFASSFHRGSIERGSRVNVETHPAFRWARAMALPGPYGDSDVSAPISGAPQGFAEMARGMLDSLLQHHVMGQSAAVRGGQTAQPPPPSAAAAAASDGGNEARITWISAGGKGSYQTTAGGAVFAHVWAASEVGDRVGAALALTSLRLRMLQPGCDVVRVPPFAHCAVDAVAGPAEGQRFVVTFFAAVPLRATTDSTRPAPGAADHTSAAATKLPLKREGVLLEGFGNAAAPAPSADDGGTPCPTPSPAIAALINLLESFGRGPNRDRAMQEASRGTPAPPVHVGVAARWRALVGIDTRVYLADFAAMLVHAFPWAPGDDGDEAAAPAATIAPRSRLTCQSPPFDARAFCSACAHGWDAERLRRAASDVAKDVQVLINDDGRHPSGGRSAMETASALLRAGTLRNAMRHRGLPMRHVMSVLVAALEQRRDALAAAAAEVAEHNTKLAAARRNAAANLRGRDDSAGTTQSVLERSQSGASMLQRSGSHRSLHVVPEDQLKNTWLAGGASAAERAAASAPAPAPAAASSGRSNAKGSRQLPENRATGGGQGAEIPATAVSPDLEVIRLLVAGEVVARTLKWLHRCEVDAATETFRLLGRNVPPRPEQHAWLLNRLLYECVSDNYEAWPFQVALAAAFKFGGGGGAGAHHNKYLVQPGASAMEGPPVPGAATLGVAPLFAWLLSPPSGRHFRGDQEPPPPDPEALEPRRTAQDLLSVIGPQMHPWFAQAFVNHCLNRRRTWFTGIDRFGRGSGERRSVLGQLSSRCFLAVVDSPRADARHNPAQPRDEEPTQGPGITVFDDSTDSDNSDRDEDVPRAPKPAALARVVTTATLVVKDHTGLKQPTAPEPTRTYVPSIDMGASAGSITGGTRKQRHVLALMQRTLPRCCHARDQALQRACFDFWARPTISLDAVAVVVDVAVRGCPVGHLDDTATSAAAKTARLIALRSVLPKLAKSCEGARGEAKGGFLNDLTAGLVWQRWPRAAQLRPLSTDVAPSLGEALITAAAAGGGSAAKCSDAHFDLDDAVALGGPLWPVWAAATAVGSALRTAAAARLYKAVCDFEPADFGDLAVMRVISEALTAVPPRKNLEPLLADSVDRAIVRLASLNAVAGAPAVLPFVESTSGWMDENLAAVKEASMGTESCARAIVQGNHPAGGQRLLFGRLHAALGVFCSEPFKEGLRRIVAAVVASPQRHHDGDSAASASATRALPPAKVLGCVVVLRAVSRAIAFSVTALVRAASAQQRAAATTLLLRAVSGVMESDVTVEALRTLEAICGEGSAQVVTALTHHVTLTLLHEGIIATVGAHSDAEIDLVSADAPIVGLAKFAVASSAELTESQLDDLVRSGGFADVLSAAAHELHARRRFDEEAAVIAAIARLTALRQAAGDAAASNSNSIAAAAAVSANFARVVDLRRAAEGSAAYLQKIVRRLRPVDKECRKWAGQHAAFNWGVLWVHSLGCFDLASCRLAMAEAIMRDAIERSWAAAVVPMGTETRRVLLIRAEEERLHARREAYLRLYGQQLCSVAIDRALCGLEKDEADARDVIEAEFEGYYDDDGFLRQAYIAARIRIRNRLHHRVIGHRS